MRSRSLLAAIIAVIAIFGVIFTMSVSVVKPREVGIEVLMGKPKRELSNGFHFVNPISNVEKMDTSLQTVSYSGDTSIPARLANGSVAHVDASIQWSLKDEAAPEMFMRYREFERIQTDLVDVQLKESINKILGDYDPLNPENIKEDGKSASDLAPDVESELGKRVGEFINIESVTLPLVRYDENTQRRIDDFQTEIARTRVAEQREATAAADARANRAKTESLSEEILTDKCLDIALEIGEPMLCFNNGATPVVDMRSSK